MAKRQRSAFWLALMTWITGGTASAELAVGDPAPDFSMLGSDGATYTLSQYKDREGVVLAWFPKAFTPG